MDTVRTAFFISDRTGITAEGLGQSLLSQFEGSTIHRVTLPFVDTPEKAHAANRQIANAADHDGARPIVFSTLIHPEIRAIIAQSNALVLDIFGHFMHTLEQELGMKSSLAIGRLHAANTNYSARMEAVNYALSHDDGGITRDLERAQIILIGVSRCGKTPTSLYLAMQFGIFAANYPLVPEDFQSGRLPLVLQPLKTKLFGLTIQAERLHQIRSERLPDSEYASIKNCKREIEQAEAMMNRANLSMLDVTTMSVEEIATTLLHVCGLQRGSDRTNS